MSNPNASALIVFAGCFIGLTCILIGVRFGARELWIIGGLVLIATALKIVLPYHRQGDGGAGGSFDAEGGGAGD